jgi:hypothetical protein
LDEEYSWIENHRICKWNSLQFHIQLHLHKWNAYDRSLCISLTVHHDINQFVITNLMHICFIS